MARDKRLLIDRKQRQLLLRSEVTKEFSFLEKMLESYETIRKENVTDLPTNQKIFFSDSLPAVLKRAQAEWYAEKGCQDHGETSVPCTLCETPNRYIYYITNRINGTSINVGSDCVNTYFDDISEKKGPQGFINDREQARKVRRLDEFYQHFPGATRLLDSWTQDLNLSPVMIPAALESEIREIAFKGKQLIKDYQNKSKKDQEILSEFSSILEQHKILETKVSKFIDDNKENMWIVTRPIYNWLKQNNKNRVIDALKTDCCINIQTFSEIWEPNHIKTIKPRLSGLLSEIDITLTSDNYSNTLFSLKYGGPPEVSLEIYFNHLLSLLGPYIFGKKNPPLDFEVLNRIMHLCNLTDEKSFYNLLLYLNEVLQGEGYIFPYYQPEYEEVFVVDENRNLYSEQRLSEIARMPLKFNVLKNPEEIGDMINIISSARKWYPIEQLSEFLNDRYGGKKKWYPIKDRGSVTRLGEKRENRAW